MNNQFEKRLLAIEYELSQIAESEYLDELKNKFNNQLDVDVVLNIIPSRDVSFKTRSLLSQILDRLELTRQDRLDLEKYIIYGGGDNIEYLKQTLAIWVEWKDKILNILQGAPEEFDSLIEIFNYINNHITESNIKLEEINNNILNLNENIPFEKGDGENSAILKGEYEGYSNKAISQTSMAVGAATTAGLKGWYYSNITFGSKPVITLSDKQPYALLGNLVGGYWDSGAPNISVGDKVSIVNNTKYDYCGEVESVSDNKVTLKSALPFDTLDISTITVNNLDDWSIYLPDKESVGIIDFGGGAFSEGGLSKATNIAAHAEGLQTHAYGQYSHAEGRETKAGYAAHAEGRETNAVGESSHTEGLRTKTIDIAGHAEGADTIAGQKAHAEGSACEATGYASHAEGSSSKSIGQHSHAEGKECESHANNSHAEGSGSKALDQAAHAEGVRTEAGYVAHAEGYETKASGKYSHSEGYRTTAFGESVHVEGVQCNASNIAGHAEGYKTTSGYLPSYTKATYYKCVSKNKIWLTGTQTIPKINETVYTEGYVAPFKVGDRVFILRAYNKNSNMKQFACTVINVDRNVITVDAYISHLLSGESIIDNRSYSIINLTTGEGKTTIDEIFTKDVPGFKEFGMYAHSEGSNTIAEGNSSHAEGNKTIAKGSSSHVEGLQTIANNEAEHACGKYNISTNSNDSAQTTQFSIGIGTSDTDRKNAVEVKQNGDVYITGIGGFTGANSSSSKSVQEVINELIDKLNEITTNDKIL